MANAEMRELEREAIATESWTDGPGRDRWETFIGIPNRYERRALLDRPRARGDE